jgi:hypothetical protein
MIKHDFHGNKLEDALRQADIAVGKVRQAGKTETAEFIVGHGVIRDELIQLLKAYGLNPTIKMGNSGVITVIIE